MITTFSANSEEFAASRRKVINDIEAALHAEVAEALARVGLPFWEYQIVNAALDIFDVTARAEVDAWSQNLDDLREMFAKELQDALGNTKRQENRDAQVEAITRWVSQMTHNAAMEAATSTDPNELVGLEWVCMEDSSVRAQHREAHGQTVPTGEAFQVGDVELLYPGQPVGDPSNWMNCRCVARPTMLEGFSAVSRETFSAAPGLKKDGTPPKCAYCEVPATQYVLHSEGMAYVPACDDHIDQAKQDAEASVPGGEPDPGNVDRIGRYSLTASADDPQWDGLKQDLARMGAQLVDAPSTAGTGNASDPGLEEGEDPKAAVIVLRPRVDDPVVSIASGTHPHCTLLYLGDGTVDLEPLKGIVESVATATNALMTDKVSGRGTLGKDSADVLLLDANASGLIRSQLMAEDGVLELLGMQEQFPAWVPHMTIGYPEAPAVDGDLPTDVTYDLLSIWRGNEIYDYPLGGAVPEKTEPTQEASNAFATTATPTAPAADAQPAEAAPAIDAGQGSDHRPWHAVLAPEAAPSGDDREFAERALTMRDLPLPLKAMFVDNDGHKGSVVVGRIDRVWRDAGLIKAEGVWDITPEAERAAGMVERRMWRGVSVDLDAVKGQMVEAAKGDNPTAEYTQGRISSATMCAIPAFAEAFVRNGTWADYDGQPMPTGAMNEIPDVEAVALVASATAIKKISADYFRNPMLTEPTPLSLGEDGHIFGHIGAWDACHIGFEVCTTVPPSNTDYAYFLTGQVFTDAGPVAVGQITLGKADVGGHAPDGISLSAAIAHYDRTGTAVADITVGEDEFGVWFSGKLRDRVTEEQIHELFAAGLSGDWRGVRYRGSDSMELIAALAVNVQGFPIPRTRFALDGDRQVSLVAAGMIQREKPAQLDPAFKSQMDLYFAQQKRNEEAAALSAELRRMQFEFVTSEITSLKGK